MHITTMESITVKFDHWQKPALRKYSGYRFFSSIHPAKPKDKPEKKESLKFSVEQSLSS